MQKKSAAKRRIRNLWSQELLQSGQVLLESSFASGGGGTMPHFKTVFEEGKADAALAASIFHFKEITIPELKGYLQQQHIAVRI